MKVIQIVMGCVFTSMFALGAIAGLVMREPVGLAFAALAILTLIDQHNLID